MFWTGDQREFRCIVWRFHSNKFDFSFSDKQVHSFCFSHTNNVFNWMLCMQVSGLNTWKIMCVLYGEIVRIYLFFVLYCTFFLHFSLFFVFGPVRCTKKCEVTFVCCSTLFPGFWPVWRGYKCHQIRSLYKRKSSSPTNYNNSLPTSGNFFFRWEVIKIVDRRWVT